jgi:hypothetical protein
MIIVTIIAAVAAINAAPEDVQFAGHGLDLVVAQEQLTNGCV